MAALTLNVEHIGQIVLKFRPDAAPTTVDFVKKYVEAGLYNGGLFYRSDFVIQCGTHGLGRENPVRALEPPCASHHPHTGRARRWATCP
jgi:cyclophilin family peptidyl-prolyl cis-trans isomerase